MEATTVYLKTVQASEKYKIICHEGGSRSSKTYSIFQFFIVKALSGQEFTLTIARDKFTWIKDTLLEDFADITSKYDIKVTPAINRNRPEQIYFIGRARFTFWGLDTPAKVHGKKQDWVWINEAMDVNKKTFDQLEMRTTTGMILDYNPVDDLHWVFKLQLRKDVTRIHSTLLDNPFIGEFEKRKILSYEPTPENITAGTADTYMWEVYGKGQKARLKGAIFTNWDNVDSIPDDANFLGYGLDFGYTNDPSTLIELWKFNNELYVHELFYKEGMTNPDISNKMKQLEIPITSLIVADSSEPKSIDEIKADGYFNMKGVVKGADSVRFGLDLLKNYKIHVTKSSVNLDREMRRYKWLEDKNGESQNEPIDDFNHAIDAMRYVAMTVLQKKIPVKLDFEPLF